MLCPNLTTQQQAIAKSKEVLAFAELYLCDEFKNCRANA
jgi:hypothetical protein